MDDEGNHPEATAGGDDEQPPSLDDGRFINDVTTVAGEATGRTVDCQFFGPTLITLREKYGIPIDRNTMFNWQLISSKWILNEDLLRFVIGIGYVCDRRPLKSPHPNPTVRHFKCWILLRNTTMWFTTCSY